MTQEHTFLFEPGEWTGEGSVAFSNSDDQLEFTTTWNFKAATEDGIFCEQVVNMEGVDDPVKNYLQFYNLTPTHFKVSLQSRDLGEVFGKGVIDNRTIAWELTGQITTQGFEVFERQEDGEYKFHAEYASPNQFRTIINGRIRRSNG